MTEQPTAPPCASTTIPRTVFRTLNEAFEKFVDAGNPNRFLIVENTREQFLQFTNLSAGSLEVDLPTHPLTPRQLVAAQQFLLHAYDAKMYGVEGERHFSFTFRAPSIPEYLTLLTLQVFEKVYDDLPKEPLVVTVDEF